MRSFPTIVSRRADFGWFVLPGIAAAIWGLFVGLGGESREDTPLFLWILAVLLVDVAHVYASLYRTYFDAEARRLHRKRLIAIPLLCAWFSFLLHLESPLLFWGVLAYVAIFHFIKQHVGFALLYVRAGGEARLDRLLTAWAIWAGTAGPVLYWHASLPTAFAWFVPGDLLAGAPSELAALALWGQLPFFVAFLARRAQLFFRGHRNPMVPLLVLLPAVNWHLGIVVFNDDRVFTITNVFLHGIPYLALVWVAGGRGRVATTIRSKSSVLIGAAFYGLLVVLALTEEALWDRLVWHDHPELFGAGGPTLEPDSILLAALVALLTVPQATHYILDRYIWRVGPDNPRLAEQLGFGRKGP